MTATRTLGVALHIPKPYGGRLQEWRRSFGDPQADSIPTHVTLLPPTPVAEADWNPVMDMLAAIADNYSPFIVGLRGTGTFRPVSPVVFVAMARGIADCQTLSTAIRTGPLDIELSFPYHPHVTVAHNLTDEQLDVAEASLSDYELTFMAHGFGAYRHDDDGQWRLTRSFDFGP
ncbi:2'-5' RNA ligase family protein [Spelaeicoccus albus]|uniref:2'-5' RNA ligase n=1 Tax=Spelaeicoccus albus TaxID=1280376 RepID=A0A7Z0IJA0_9MICO|nr:2'-5' RNA ligase family protein [Spelaeicoccus albus]NYI69288.1 2'-5' RNA ligase [Spelaeicoccus albus]